MSRITLPSASQLTRALACQDSVLVWPQVETAPTSYTFRGDTIDRYVSELARGESRENALTLVEADDPNRTACELLDVTTIPRGGHVQIPLAWNPYTNVGRVLGQNLGRDYSGAKRDEEFVGTFDYLGELRPGAGALIDFKSGWRTIPAKQSWQLLGGATFAAAAFDWQSVWVAHLDLRDPERPRWDGYEVDAFQLGAARERLKSYAKWYAEQATSPDEPGRFVEGEHCRYCPSFAACPAKLTLINQMSIDVATGRLASLVTQENAALVWNTLDRYDEMAKHLRARAVEIAERLPLSLGNGRMLQLAPGRDRDEVDSEKAIHALSEIIGSDIAMSSVVLTKESIGRAVSEYCKANEEPVTRTKKAVIEELRRRGAIEKKPGKLAVRVVEGG